MLVCGKKRTCDEEEVRLQETRNQASKEQSSVMPNGKGTVTEPQFVGQFGFDMG